MPALPRATSAVLAGLVVILAMIGVPACGRAADDGAEPAPPRVSTTAPQADEDDGASNTSGSAVPRVSGTLVPDQRAALFALIGTTIDLRHALFVESRQVQQAAWADPAAAGGNGTTPGRVCPPAPEQLDQAIADFRAAVAAFRDAGGTIADRDGSPALASRFAQLADQRRAACARDRDPVSLVDDYVQTASELVILERGLTNPIADLDLERLFATHADLAARDDAEAAIGSRLLVPVWLGFYPVYAERASAPPAKTTAAGDGCGEDPSQADADACPSWSRPARDKHNAEVFRDSFESTATDAERHLRSDVALSSPFYNEWNRALQDGVGSNDLRAPASHRIDPDRFVADGDANLDELTRIEHQILAAGEASTR